MHAGVDLVLVPQAIGATEQLGRRVETMEDGGRRPLWGPIVRELGAPAVTAGLVGVFENPMPEEIGDYLSSTLSLSRREGERVREAIEQGAWNCDHLGVRR